MTQPTGLGRITDLDDVVQVKQYPPMLEVGKTGLKRVSGIVQEEFLPQLRGRKAVQIYREMSENDAIVGALLFAVERLLRQLEWRVEPASNSAEDRQNAEFVEQCMDDMSHTWDDLIAEILTMLIYGFSWHEIVYKRRVGPWEKDPKKRSKYTDGKIGWRKIPIRGQETLFRWGFDDDGSIKVFYQMSPPNYEQVALPIEKSLLFRTTTTKNNPEGKSILRNAYRSWYLKKRLEEIEAVGVERDLAGLPVARVPSTYLDAPQGSKEAQMIGAFRKMVQSVRRDENEGIVLPSLFDQDTKQQMFDFQLLTSGGSRQFDTNALIQRYEQRILMTCLADFILVGHEQTGSYNMHTDKTGLFKTTLDSLAKSIADVFNRYAIPRLFSINGVKPDELPTIVPNSVDPPDITQLSAFISQMTTAGMQFFPDPKLEQFIRDAADLPKLDEEQEAVKEMQARQQNIMDLANQRFQMLQMHQQGEQGEMGAQQQQMGIQQQQAAMEADPTGQGPADPTEKDKVAQAKEGTNQQKLNTQQQKVRLEQEKQKLANLKKPAPKKAAPRGKK